MGKRLDREIRTVRAMVALYCRRHHGSDAELCPACKEQLDFALYRLERCRYGDDKPPCKDCVTHCFKEPNRTRIREIMADSGPRMLFHHPILGILHLLDSRRKAK